MADQGNVETMLYGLPVPEQRILRAVFEYILNDVRFGRAEDGESAQNMGGGFFRATTPAIADTEFAIAHSFGHPPYLLIPVLPLNVAGAKIVRLTVSRAADSTNVYLKSPDASAPITVFLEG
jgi:hypothetical protein